jgi:hypothetical protein
MTDASSVPTKARAKKMPARMRVEDARTVVIPPVRCTVRERAAIRAGAERAGLSVGAFMRASALGNAGPRAVRRPPVERKELARLLGHLGKVGSNVNQLARGFNVTGVLPGFPELLGIREDVRQMRDALMKALGRGD